MIAAMPTPRWIVIAAVLCGAQGARAGGGDDDPEAARAAVADRLLDLNVGDAGVTWAAMDEACGMDCEVVAWGGCTLDAGAIDCEVRVQDVTAKKPTVITVRGADRDPAALATGRAQLIAALGDTGVNPLWLDEHRFDTPAVDVTTWNVTFRWNWKTKALTVLDGKKKYKAVKAPRLRKGLGLTSAAIWYKIADEGSGGWGVLRLHGEGDEGEVGDATALVKLPGLRGP